MLNITKTRKNYFFCYKSFNGIHKRNLSLQDRILLEIQKQARLSLEQDQAKRAWDTLERVYFTPERSSLDPIVVQMRSRCIQLHSRLSIELRESRSRLRRLSLLQSVTRYDNNGNNISNGRNNGNGNNNNANNNSKNNANNGGNSNSNLNRNSTNVSIIFSFLIVALVITIFVLCSLGLPLDIIPVFECVKLIA